MGFQNGSHTPCLGYMKVVPSRHMNTATIHSDQWRPYGTLKFSPTCDNPWGDESLCTLCGPCNWGSHPNCKELLQSREDKAEETNFKSLGCGESGKMGNDTLQNIMRETARQYCFEVEVIRQHSLIVQALIWHIISAPSCPY